MFSSLQEIVFTEKDKYSYRPELQIVGFGVLVCLVTWVISDLALFGHKSTAIFDVWTLTHIAAGAVLSYVAILMRRIDLQHPIMFLLLLSFGWEIVEHYVEISNIAYLSDWFAGEENY